jgi:hypothetical protein
VYNHCIQIGIVGKVNASMAMIKLIMVPFVLIKNILTIIMYNTHHYIVYVANTKVLTKNYFQFFNFAIFIGQ